MAFSEQNPVSKLKWHFVVIYIAISLLAVMVLFTIIAGSVETLQQITYLMGALIVLIAALVMLSKAYRITEVLESNGRKLDHAVNSLDKMRSTLSQLNNTAQLSETAKNIVFRQADERLLREAVFDKLHQQDFEATAQLIAQIASHDEYKELASLLKAEAESYKNSSEQERIDRIVEHIDGLLEAGDWARASAQIERLAESAAPEVLRQMRQKLVDMKQQRKRELLNAWDEAVKRQATDRSLEILKELDQYLTPNEGLALQEAARDVFRTKLHNLGVQFSLAVSEREWNRALKIGQQIIEEFPNSKMAAEIRQTRPALLEKAQKPNQ